MFSVEFDANIALSIWWFQAVTSLQTAMLAYSGTFLLPTSWGNAKHWEDGNRGYVSRCWQKSPKWSLSPNPQGWQRSQMLCLWVGARAKKRYVRFHRCFFCENYQHFIHSLGQKSKLVRNYMDFSMTEPPRFDLEWMAVLVVSCFFLNQP